MWKDLYTPSKWILHWTQMDLDEQPTSEENYEIPIEDTNTFKLRDASENVGKDELGDASFHLRVDKLFHHIHLEVYSI